jgi:hypothetical protein
MAGKPRGGSRKGRPNKSKEEVRNLIDKVGKFHGGMDAVFDGLFRLAKGVTIQKVDKDGDPFIYEAPPDAFAARILAEYRFGKPAQRIGFGDDEDDVGAVKVTIIRKK